jgi:hypothetical protein
MLDAMSIELDAFVDERLAYDGVLRQSGHIQVAETLQPVQTATPVRIRNGEVSTTDGPLAEANAQLGGFFLINARDLDDAVRGASRSRRRAGGASRSRRSGR